MRISASHVWCLHVHESGFFFDGNAPRRRWGSASTNSEDDDLYGSTLILDRSALYKKPKGSSWRLFGFGKMATGSHLDVAQVAVSLGSLTVEMAIFDAARAFFDLALRNYTLDESADAHPRAAHALSRVWRASGATRARRCSSSAIV